MLIAIPSGNTFALLEHRVAFPQVSFPASGPGDEFYTANNCHPVSLWRAHDSATEKLEPTDPYLESGVVYTANVVDLTAEEIAAREAAKLAAFMKSVEMLVQARLNAFAQTRNYDSILSAATYAFSSVPRFSADGAYAVVVRDATWAALYQLMDNVQAGITPMPTNFEDDIEPLLPVLEWPV